MNRQQSLLLDTVKLRPAQAEVLEAMRWLVAAGTTSDIQRALSAHGIPREKNCIAKRLHEVEALGLVERVGHDFSRKGSPTVWRRV